MGNFRGRSLNLEKVKRGFPAGGQGAGQQICQGGMKQLRPSGAPLALALKRTEYRGAGSKAGFLIGC